MTLRVWTDRSRIETYQHCKRERWLTYHEQGQGITPKRKPLPLAVGGAVHKGLESLLRDSMTRGVADMAQWLPFLEDAAVDAAIADLAQYRGALEVDAGERLAQAATTLAPVVAMDYEAQLVAQAKELGMSPEDVAGLMAPRREEKGAAEWDEWLWQEQSALVEGMVRAYARRRLRPLLEEFEVLEVEREGEWELFDWSHEGHILNYGKCTFCGESMDDFRDNGIEQDRWMRADCKGRTTELWFMSRPDALLRHRTDNSLYLLSFKTAASWDQRKARDAEHDMQGLSEGVEVERRLGEWWHLIAERHCADLRSVDRTCTPAMYKYLLSVAAPPRILAIRYEYLLKGERWKDKDLSARFGFECRSQKSPLVRAYVNAKTGERNWSWEFLKDDGSESKLAWQSWKSQPVDGPVKDWIDDLDSAEMAMSAYDSTVGMEPRELGWKCRAQATGYTKDHPLDSLFIPPITVYRSDDDLRDWLEQTESQERTVVESVAAVNAAADADSRRSALNVHFPQTRRACSYPSECAFVKVCYGGEDIRRAPLDSGLYQIRVPNHEAERKEAANDHTR